MQGVVLCLQQAGGASNLPFKLTPLRDTGLDMTRYLTPPVPAGGKAPPKISVIVRKRPLNAQVCCCSLNAKCPKTCSHPTCLASVLLGRQEKGAGGLTHHICDCRRRTAASTTLFRSIWMPVSSSSTSPKSKWT